MSNQYKCSRCGKDFEDDNDLPEEYRICQNCYDEEDRITQLGDEDSSDVFDDDHWD